MLRIIYVVSFILCLGHTLYAQKFHIPSEKKFEKVRFELINNLIVIPVELNGSKLSFILDSGVTSPILFNLSNQDSIQINNVSKITLRGLGEGEPMDALKSTNNTLKLGKAFNFSQSLFVVLDKDLNFSTSLGIPVHGIIGYDIFNSFIVEINYTGSYLKLYPNESYNKKKLRKHQELPLAIYKKRSYLSGSILLEDSAVPVKLLVDTGSSDALWLFHDPEKGVEIPDVHYEDFLGRGLSGNIFGKRTKLKGIEIGNFLLEDAKAAFPFKESFSAIKSLGDRNGSLGGEVLKRFNLVFDYKHNKLYLKKNNNYKRPFNYDMAGIALQHNGVRYISESITNDRGLVIRPDKNNHLGNVQLLYDNQTRLSLVPEIVVSGIRVGSPAQEAGLKEGDIILAVNGKSVHEFKLQEILSMINYKEGKKVRVLVERYNKDLLFSFVVKDIFKLEKP